MIRTPAIPIPYERQQVIENRVREGFYGYIGNEEAVYAIERDLILALADEQPRLARAFLLWGPSSAGKTEMAKRVAGVMGLPFNTFAGATLKNVKQVISTMERAAAANQTPIRPAGERGGREQIDMAKAVIRWVDGDKVFTPAEFIKHLEGMGIPKDTMGKKQMVMHLDSKTHYESTYEWEIAGKKFVQHVSCKRDKKDMMYWA